MSITSFRKTFDGKFAAALAPLSPPENPDGRPGAETHIQALEKAITNLQALLAEQEALQASVNVTPYREPDDRYESFANDFGDDLYNHYSGTIRDCRRKTEELRRALEKEAEQLESAQGTSGRGTACSAM